MTKEVGHSICLQTIIIFQWSSHWYFPFQLIPSWTVFKDFLTLWCICIVLHQFSAGKLGIKFKSFSKVHTRLSHNTSLTSFYISKVKSTKIPSFRKVATIPFIRHHRAFLYLFFPFIQSHLIIRKSRLLTRSTHLHAVQYNITIAKYNMTCF
jgi:hypothetical protein